MGVGVEGSGEKCRRVIVDSVFLFLVFYGCVSLMYYQYLVAEAR